MNYNSGYRERSNHINLNIEEGLSKLDLNIIFNINTGGKIIKQNKRKNLKKFKLNLKKKLK